MKDQFKQFLKDEGVYNEFVEQLQRRGRPISLDAYLDENEGTEDCYLLSAFSWGKEFNKWNKINDKWTKSWKNS